MSDSKNSSKATLALGWAKVTAILKAIRGSMLWCRTLFKSQPAPLDYILLVVAIVAAIAAGIPFPLLGVIFGQLMNDLNSSSCNTSDGNVAELRHAVRTKVLQIIYVTIANFVLIYVHTTCWTMFGERLVRRIRRDYVKSLVRQDATFFDKLEAGAGDVTSRLVTDVEAVQTGTSEKVGIFIASVSYFVAAYIVAFLKAPVIAGILVSVLPAYILMAIFGGHFVVKYATRISTHIEAATSVVSSSLSNMPLVHAFGAQDRLVGLFTMHLSKTRKDDLKKAIAQASQLGLLYFIAYSSNALAFWEGSREIASAVGKGDSGVTVGAVYTVIFVLLDASFIISQVAPFVHIFHAAGAASERLDKTISRRPVIDATITEGRTDFSLSQDDVTFENVSFAYPGRPELPALRDISICFPAGKSTAIVGASGGGKSTLIALLERLYDPDAGKITVGSIDLKDVNLRHFRSQIGFVEQGAPLLDRSILENVVYGLAASNGNNALTPQIFSELQKLVSTIQEGTQEDHAIQSATFEVQQLVAEVKAALDMAYATEFVQKLPHGIATAVGSSASQLSGGQRQRVVLARALIRKPELLILDEATASLDSTSERLIQTAISAASQGKTVVSIAHRLATIQQADNIVVIQGGQIVEQGNHSTLLQKNGEYAKMVSIQNVGGEEERPETSPVTSGSTAEVTRDEKAIVSSTPSTVTLPEQEKHSSIMSSNEKTSPGYPEPTVNGKLGLIPLLRPAWPYILAGVFASVIVGGSYTGEALLFGKTVGRLSTCNTEERIRSSGELFGLLFFILAIIEFIALIVNGSSFGLGAATTLFRVRRLTFGALLRQPLEWHNSESRTPGTLLSVITSDATALSSLTGSTIGVITATSVGMIAGIILAHIVAWKIAVVLLATIPILLATGYMRLRIISQFHERHQKAFAKSTAITLEAVENIKTIAALSLEATVYYEFDDSLSVPYQATLKAIANSSVWLAMAFSVPNLVYALGYWWGSKQIFAGLYNQTQFLTVLPALLFSTQACTQMFALAPDVSKARSATRHVLELINTNIEADIDDTRKPGDPEKGVISESLTERRSAASISSNGTHRSTAIGLSFNNVHFSYPSRPNHPALRGISLDISPGQFVALVGPSGQGKSTILNLIERFYVPNSGSIIIDHTNITAQRSTSFRSRISLVPQSSVLFTGTIAFNLSLGASPGVTASQAAFEDACRLVGIHDFILSLPKGYETMITSSANQFSGGQRQRLCIARALVRKPALLLLDESTSALDTESERLVQESLERIRKEGEVTIIAIAHRLNTVAEADKLFWIEGGQVGDSGSHKELMSTCDGYSEAVRLQRL